MVIICSKINNKVSPILKNVQDALKELLMKDFSESLATRIIWRNCRNHRLRSEVLEHSYEKLISSIASDYEAINPLGRIKAAQLKKDLRAALDRTVQ